MTSQLRYRGNKKNKNDRSLIEDEDWIARNEERRKRDRNKKRPHARHSREFIEASAINPLQFISEHRGRM